MLLKVILKRGVCTYRWINSWVPATIRLEVKDESDAPLPSVMVDFYRRKLGGKLTPSDLWFTGMTDSNGHLHLPSGLTPLPINGYFYSVYLAAVHTGGETYLNWYGMADIAIPFREGVDDLSLPAPVNDETLYEPPVPVSTDLEVGSTSMPAGVVSPGDSWEKSFVITNLGPDTFSGQIYIQNWFSTDTTVDPGLDHGAGGYRSGVFLAPGDHFSNSGAVINIPIGLAPGVYYMLTSVEPDYPGATDPDLSNNSLASVETITVTDSVPAGESADLMVENIEMPAGTVVPGETWERTFNIRNLGPDSYSGKILFQTWLSTDLTVDGSEVDHAAGGYLLDVDLGPWDDVGWVNQPMTIPGDLPPGVYYLLATVAPSGSSTLDPDESNNSLASVETITVAAP